MSGALPRAPPGAGGPPPPPGFERGRGRPLGGGSAPRPAGAGRPQTRMTLALQRREALWFTRSEGGLGASLVLWRRAFEALAASSASRGYARLGERHNVELLPLTDSAGCLHHRSRRWCRRHPDRDLCPRLCYEGIPAFTLKRANSRITAIGREARIVLRARNDPNLVMVQLVWALVLTIFGSGILVGLLLEVLRQGRSMIGLYIVMEILGIGILLPGGRIIRRYQFTTGHFKGIQNELENFARRRVCHP